MTPTTEKSPPMSSLKDQIGRLLGLNGHAPVKPEPTAEEDLDTFRLSPNRSDYRRMGRVNRGGERRTPRVFYNRRTGTTSHFRQWKRDGEAKKILRKISTAEWLKTDRPKGFPVLTCEGLAERYPTIWDLANATRVDLKRGKGIANGQLAKLQDALVKRGVTPVWAEKESA